MRKIYKILLTLFLFGLITSFCYAQESDMKTWDLSVTVEKVLNAYIEGDLRFGSLGIWKGESEVQKGVRARIVSNTGKQYQVLLELAGSLSNEKGYSLPKENIKLSVTNGESGGRSEVLSITPIRFGRNVIFTSNQKGYSDSFIITFNIKLDKPIPAGKYETVIILEVKDK